MTPRTELITNTNHVWLLDRTVFPAGDEGIFLVRLMKSYV